MFQCSSYEEYKRLQELVRMQGCFNFTNNGECSKCGSCCSALLPLKKSEIDRLKRLIKARHIKPHEQPLIVNAVDLTCPFLTDDNKCSIYDERPFICRVFKCDTKPTAEDVDKLDEPLIPVNVRELFKGL
jgi:Fe-S-cluster containining protein